MRMVSPTRAGARCVVVLLSVCVLSPAAFSQSDSASKTKGWPQFLGPARNGISTETGLIEQWPDGGLPEVWRVAGGIGMSAVAVQEGLACTMIQKQGPQSLLALDSTTGATKWSTPVAPLYRNQMGNGPRATPALHDGAAYVFTGDGTLARIELKEGALTWKVDVFKRFPGKPADYGMACSPLIWGDSVIVTIGSRDATVVAFAMKDGKTTWTAGKGETAGYSSPAVLNVAGKSQLVVFAGASAFGLNEKGERLWQYPYKTDYDCNIATPLLIDGKVFISSGENHGSTLLTLKPAAGGFQTGIGWESTGTGSVLRNEWQTSILLDGHLYGFDNVGSAGPVTHLTCVDAATGKRLWREPRFGKGNMIAADGKLIILTMKGELVVVRANPETFDVLGRMANVTGMTRQSPSLSNGRLFLRDEADIVCLDIRARKD